MRNVNADRGKWMSVPWLFVQGGRWRLQSTTELSENAFLYFTSRNNMKDRLDALTIFVAVAEQQSFGEAARQLGRSPASVTRAVAALEEHLQTRLFNRTTRSVALTDAGVRYLESCRQLLAAYDELQTVNLDERVQPRGWINITAPVMFGRLHVLPLVRKLSRRKPACHCSAAVARPGCLIGGRRARSGRQDWPVAGLFTAGGACRAGPTHRLCRSAIHCPPRRANDAARSRQAQCGGVHSRHTHS